MTEDIIDPQDIIDQKAQEQAGEQERTEAIEIRDAKRIGKRALGKLKKGTTHSIVKGGLLGAARTIHSPRTYEHVQEHLAPHGAEIEVHRYEPNEGSDGGDTRRDELTVRKVHGREVGELPPHIREPFIDYWVTRLYPPEEKK